MVRGGPEGTVYRVHYNRAHTETPRVAETVAARTGRNCACYFKTQPCPDQLQKGLRGGRDATLGTLASENPGLLKGENLDCLGALTGPRTWAPAELGEGWDRCWKRSFLPGKWEMGNGRVGRSQPSNTRPPHAHTSSVWIDNIPGCCLPFFALFPLSSITVRRLVRAHRGPWSNPESSVFHAETRVLPSVDQHQDELIARNSPTTCGPLSTQSPSPRW